MFMALFVAYQSLLIFKYSFNLIVNAGRERKINTITMRSDNLSEASNGLIFDSYKKKEREL